MATEAQLKAYKALQKSARKPTYNVVDSQGNIIATYTGRGAYEQAQGKAKALFEQTGEHYRVAFEPHPKGE